MSLEKGSTDFFYIHSLLDKKEIDLNTVTNFRFEKKRLVSKNFILLLFFMSYYSIDQFDVFFYLFLPYLFIILAIYFFYPYKLVLNFIGYGFFVATLSRKQAETAEKILSRQGIFSAKSE